MQKPHRLTESEREFFQWVARAAFANPFGPQREEAERHLGGGAVPAQERAARMLAKVVERLRRLASAGRADIRLYRKADRELLRTALLFDAFHQFIPRIDQHIEVQARAGDKTVASDFAGDLLGLLERGGFAADEARHMLAVFFQLRRAYRFIVRGLAGSSPCMLEFKRRLWNNLFTSDMPRYVDLLWRRMEDFSTLLLGETGTGKGAAAAALGRSGYIPFDESKGAFAASFARAFIPINLCQYPEALLESELFGHRKGSFTGAISDHQGVLARCSPHGAIFLDEIGDVGIPVQVKLLQVLQDRVFSPVGGHERLAFRGRVIAATNRPLAALRAKGDFREDFHYRLCSDVIEVPTLRQRIAENPDELAAMLDVLVERMAGDRSPRLAGSVRAALASSPGPGYAWPGNVRELEQAARRVLLNGAYHVQTPESAEGGAAALARGLEEGAFDAEQLLAAYCRHLYHRHGTFEAVAGIVRLDRRTVRKHILQGAPRPANYGED